MTPTDHPIIPPHPLSDDELLALCVYDEAQGEPYDGQVAVAQVVLNRMRLKYQSDGTVLGTVLHTCAFSGFWYDATPDEKVKGKWNYVRVAHTQAEAMQRAMNKYAARRALVFGTSARAAIEARDGESVLPLPSDAVLYYDPAVTKKVPKWATPENFIKTLGNHAFYRAPKEPTSC